MTFLDSNIPIYAADNTDAEKHRCARGILAKAIRQSDFMISAQVLNEFANVALKKLNRTVGEVRDLVTVLRCIKTIDLSADWTARALEVKARYGIQFYDALIVVAAVAGGCSEILSEDMTDGQIYEGVVVRNPFVGQH